MNPTQRRLAINQALIGLEVSHTVHNYRTAIQLLMGAHERTVLMPMRTAKLTHRMVRPIYRRSLQPVVIPVTPI